MSDTETETLIAPTKIENPSQAAPAQPMANHPAPPQTMPRRTSLYNVAPPRMPAARQPYMAPPTLPSQYYRAPGYRAYPGTAPPTPPQVLDYDRLQDIYSRLRTEFWVKVALEYSHEMAIHPYDLENAFFNYQSHIYTARYRNAAVNNKRARIERLRQENCYELGSGLDMYRSVE